MTAETSKAVRVRIEGRVQGVWFRAWTEEAATTRGLKGWVRNRRDGAVEALFIGPPAAVDEMVELCRQGPPRAKVAAVHAAPSDELDVAGFVQKPTE